MVTHFSGGRQEDVMVRCIKDNRLLQQNHHNTVTRVIKNPQLSTVRLWDPDYHCKAFQTMKSAFKILSRGSHLDQTLKSDENGLTANKMQVQLFT